MLGDPSSVDVDNIVAPLSLSSVGAPGYWKGSGPSIGGTSLLCLR